MCVCVRLLYRRRYHLTRWSVERKEPFVRNSTMSPTFTTYTQINTAPPCVCLCICVLCVCVCCVQPAPLLRLGQVDPHLGLELLFDALKDGTQFAGRDQVVAVVDGNEAVDEVLHLSGRVSAYFGLSNTVGY